YFLEAPDLSAFLILQMKVLAEIAEKLGDLGSQKCWLKRADTLLHNLYQHSWNGHRFIAKLSRTHEHVENPTSLHSLLPLILGENLRN
ncbi:MAG: hypothetical protein ACE5NG_13585, partial [bacterium]